MCMNIIGVLGVFFIVLRVLVKVANGSAHALHILIFACGAINSDFAVLTSTRLHSRH